MSRRFSAAAVDAGFDALEIGRMTWMGLALAAIGWTLLLGEATVADVLAAKTPRSPTLHADISDIAKCIVASGFGLAVVGALQTGFGTLNRFFGAVLTRSTRRDVEPAQASVAPVVERPRRSAEPPLEQRPYRLLPDGSVEVETILGTRLFRSMAEARDFI